MMSRRDATSWIIWVLLMIAATIVMVSVRDSLDQVHVALVYLLLILGASTSGGRPLAIPLACAGFFLIDYYFQRPYGHIGDGKPLDWVALISFLLTAIVATDLVVRAKTEAKEAGRRAVEIASLAKLGSETLSAGRAEDALVRIAEVIRATVGVSEASIIPADPASTPARPVASGTGIPQAGERIQKALIPLFVEGRVVGELRLASETPVVLDAAQRRFLDAITYYAALAAERVRLVAEAEHAEALREADRLKDIVLASVSHDLRTPLTTIKALAQSEAMQGNRSAGAIEEQADRLTRLVSDLLDLSRLKGGVFSAVPELNTAEDLIGAAVRQTRGLFGDRALRTVIDLRSPALVGNFDFSQSLRVLCNLLENAVRYSPTAGSIELAARRDGAELVFSVADRGPGISEADIPRVFEPFFRAHDTSPDAGRAGLGLSIARTLAEIQGGSLRYERRDGGGSVFLLRLPGAELRADALEQSA